MDKQGGSSQKRSSIGCRFSDIASRGEILFHIGDLANFWNIRNKHTLHMTLSRYAKMGLIHRVHKGLYSIRPVSEIDPHQLGVKVLHGPAYVSCETVLFDCGAINQPPREITLVSGVSKRFELAGSRFRSRQMSDDYLFNGAGITAQNGLRTATLSRAVADCLYFNRHRYFDSAESGPIDWNEVRGVVDAMGYSVKLPKGI